MFKKSPQQIGLEKVIDSLIVDIYTMPSDIDKYSKMIDQLSKLYALKVLDQSKSVSPDTLAIVAGNLVGIVFIVGYERANIVTSKALNFILKLR